MSGWLTMPDQTLAVRAQLEAARHHDVHLMGIGGVGMAGLAAFLHDRGYRVTGCDVAENRFTQRLRESGIPVALGHDPQHITASTRLLIRSTAVPVGHPEAVEAKERDIPVVRRGECLAALLSADEDPTVVICGTHGKTTTTALCVQAITGAAGSVPTFFVGGEWQGAGRVFERGTYPAYVVEADESDGTLAHYHPDIAIVTGLDFDHMEHFADRAAFVDVFRTLIGQTKEHIIYYGDDPELVTMLTDHEKGMAYGFSINARLRATNLKDEQGGTTFTLLVDGREVGRFFLPMPGAHNVLNALAALCVVRALRLPMEPAAHALATVAPVKRRFEFIGTMRGIQVYSDYAHHPTEISALLRAARSISSGRLLALFQPHRYTRTRALGAAFPQAFAEADHVVLAPIYAASEQPLEGGRLSDLAAHFAAHEAPSFEAADSLNAAWERALECVQEGDTLLLVGAGDIEHLSSRMVEYVE